MNLIDVTEERFNEVYKKMTVAFPYEERRDFDDEKNCLNDSHFHIFEIEEDNTFVGFTAIWIYDEFIFIEHIAIDTDKRSGGYGSKCIKLLMSKYNLPIILEAEEPIEEIQIKRIKFYDRLGFKTNDFEYSQPSYHKAESVPLKILSFPEKLTQNEFDMFFGETRNTAYKNCI